MKKVNYPNITNIKKEKPKKPAPLTEVQEELKRRVVEVLDTVYPPLAIKTSSAVGGQYNAKRHNLALCIAGCLSVGLVVNPSDLPAPPVLQDIVKRREDGNSTND